MDSEKFCAEVPELIELLKPLFSLGEFDKVRTVLEERQKSMFLSVRNLKIECEKLRRFLKLMNEKYSLEERRNRKSEHERAKSVLDFKKCKREREEKEVEMRVLKGKLERADENYKIPNQLISKLNEELSKLKNQNVENEKAAARLVEMVKRLKGEKLAADNKVEEIKKRLSKADRTVKQLRDLNSEFSETIKELRRRLSRSCETTAELRLKLSVDDQTIQELKQSVEKLNESLLKSDNIIKELRIRQAQVGKTTEDLTCQVVEAMQNAEILKRQKIDAAKVAELNKKRFQMLLPVHMAIEEGLASLKKSMVADLAKFEGEFSAMLPEKDFPCSGDEKKSSDNVVLDVSDRRNSSSLSLTTEEIADDKNTKTPFQVGAQSGCPFDNEIHGVGGGNERKLLLVSGEFDLLQNVLVDRRKNLKSEFENLRRAWNLMIERCSLAERMSRRAESMKAVFLHKIQKGQRQYQKLALQMKRLRNKERLMGEMFGKADERSAADREMHSSITNEQTLAISKLLADLSTLKDRNLENNPAAMVREAEKPKGEKLAADQTTKGMRRKQSKADQTVEQLRRLNTEASDTIEALRHRLLELDGTINKMRNRQSMDDKTIQVLRQQNLEASATIDEFRSNQSTFNQIIEELRCQKLEAFNAMEEFRQFLLRSDETIEEMRCRQAEADKTIEDLRRQNLEAWQEVEELRQQKLKAEKIVELHRRRLEMLEPIRMKIEQGLANMLTLDDGADLTMSEERSSARFLYSANVPCPESGNQFVENDGILRVTSDDDLVNRGSYWWRWFIGTLFLFKCSTAILYTHGPDFGRKNLPSLPSTELEGANDKNAKISPPTGSPRAENYDIEGEKEKDTLMESDLGILDMQKTFLIV